MANFCYKCGTPLNDSNNFCTKCGASISGDAPANVTNQAAKKEQNVYAVIGLVCSIVVGGITGLAFSIIGLMKSKEMNDEGRGLAIAGIVISALKIVYVIVMLIGMFSKIALIN